MALFTREVRLVWEYSCDNKYQFDQDGNCYNVKTGRQLKRTIVNYTEGYCINSKFKSLSMIRKHLTKIEDYICPF